MNRYIINKIIVLALMLAIAADIIALVGELLSERQDKLDACQTQAEKQALTDRLSQLERRIAKLEQPPSAAAP